MMRRERTALEINKCDGWLRVLGRGKGCVGRSRSLMVPGRPPFRRARLTALTGVTILVGLLGCNVLLPAAFIGEHKKLIKAEFDRMPGSRALVVVWAEQETLFDYPLIQFELATYITDQLGSHLVAEGNRCDLVDPRDVADFLQKDKQAAEDAYKLGKQFDCDYVIVVELMRFQLRDRQTPDMLQGQVSAAVSVVAVGASASESERFELSPVDAVYPAQPVVWSAADAYGIRDQVYRIVSEEVSRKFYDHKVDL